MPNAPADPKLAALRQHQTLNPHPDALRDPLFHDQPFFDARDGLQVKYEMLRRVRVDRWSVQAASHAYGFSRVSFYHLQRRFAAGGLLALLPQPRGPRRAHKLSAAVMAFVNECLSQEPALSPTDLQQRVQQRFALTVYARSISRALARQQKKQAR